MLCLALAFVRAVSATRHTGHTSHNIQLRRSVEDVRVMSAKNYFLPHPKFLHFQIDMSTAEKGNKDRWSADFNGIFMKRKILNEKGTENK